MFLDQPYKSFGRRHRAVRHDAATICLLGLKNSKEALPAWLHVVLDESKTLQRFLKLLLEVRRR
jgi:hypothetical protein